MRASFFFSRKSSEWSRFLLSQRFSHATVFHVSFFFSPSGVASIPNLFFFQSFPHLSTAGESFQLRPLLSASSAAYCCYTCQAFTPARSNKNFPVESLSSCINNSGPKASQGALANQVMTSAVKTGKKQSHLVEDF